MQTIFIAGIDIPTKTTSDICISCKATTSPRPELSKKIKKKGRGDKNV